MWATPFKTSGIHEFEIQNLRELYGSIYFSIMSNSEQQDVSKSDDDEDLMNLLFLHYVSNTFLPPDNENRQWRQRWINKRLNWAEHVRKLGHKHAIDRTY